jgi:hypothetical protein
MQLSSNTPNTPKLIKYSAIVDISDYGLHHGIAPQFSLNTEEIHEENITTPGHRAEIPTKSPQPRSS